LSGISRFVLRKVQSVSKCSDLRSQYPAQVVLLLAASDSGAFLGDDLLPFLVLAMGGALVAGNVAAIVKPPAQHRGDDDLAKAPIGRSVAMAVVGAVAAIWALASLLS
jgi:hypothetical protein